MPIPPRDTRLSWLRLIRSENVGPRTFLRLIELFGDPTKALERLPAMAAQGGRKRPIKLCDQQAAQTELEMGESLGATLVIGSDQIYPARLAAIDDAPPVFWAKGDLALLARPAIAMVGARNASLNGRNMARRLASDLGRGGMVVVSGLARGIDTAAHEGSLASGTIAVVAGGIDVVYPPENEALYNDILSMGLVISEMPPGTQPQASHFPRRNRLVSGLSMGVLVVEASPKSGSLITARLALEQGREVFAVPGSPLDPRAQGPNDLIRHGATLVESAHDVQNALAGQTDDSIREPGRKSMKAPPAPPDDQLVAEARRPVLDCLSYTPTAQDELLRQCPFPPAVILMVLLELELAGRIDRLSGNQIVLSDRG